MKEGTSLPTTPTIRPTPALKAPKNKETSKNKSNPSNDFVTVTPELELCLTQEFVDLQDTPDSPMYSLMSEMPIKVKPGETQLIKIRFTPPPPTGRGYDSGLDDDKGGKVDYAKKKDNKEGDKKKSKGSIKNKTVSLKSAKRDNGKKREVYYATKYRITLADVKVRDLIIICSTKM